MYVFIPFIYSENNNIKTNPFHPLKLAGGLWFSVSSRIDCENNAILTQQFTRKRVKDTKAFATKIYLLWLLKKTSNGDLTWPVIHKVSMLCFLEEFLV